jgi:reverse gyrase
MMCICVHLATKGHITDLVADLVWYGAHLVCMPRGILFLSYSYTPIPIVADV